MKLYLALATLMLVLMAQCEAEEPSIEQHFANFQAKMKEFGSDLTEKTASALKQIEESELATKTKSWFTEQMEKLKQSFSKK
ncbi:apolipoprotein C-I [Trichomycterus rosablanca]|uniref:apolipoprotein C-I n=1 Tax=Trichomycterus rosablanca TaxID=2290929 RepID=UPI002F35C5B4